MHLSAHPVTGLEPSLGEHRFDRLINVPRSDERAKRPSPGSAGVHQPKGSLKPSSIAQLSADDESINRLALLLVPLAQLRTPLSRKRWVVHLSPASFVEAVAQSALSFR
jgi:hypothetical protein